MLVPKKSPTTKDEKNMIDDMEEIRNKRASVQNGIKDKWIGSGSPPPIDIVTLRQVTGVDIQPQTNERGEYEMPGIYTHIPPSRMLQDSAIPNRRIPPSLSRASQSVSQAQESSSTIINDAQTTSSVNVTVNEVPERPSKPVINQGGGVPPIAEVQAKKRKASTGDDGAPPQTNASAFLPLKLRAYK
jgi:hypothetical protein